MSTCQHWALVTVQHSGTRFVWGELKPFFNSDGWPLTRPTSELLPTHRHLYQHHCNPSAIAHMNARHLEGVRIITTDRPLADMVQSHQRRYGSTSKLDLVRGVWLDEVLPVADWIITLDGTEQDQLNEFVKAHDYERIH